MKRRRPAPARFDVGAARKWERLIAAARAVAADPAGDASALGSAAMKAFKAAAIPGQLHRGSACLELVLLGQRYAGLQRDAKDVEAFRLGRLAEQLAGDLERARAALAQPPTRADIHG